MILDSSCIVAVLKNEPERSSFEELIVDNDCSLSAANFLETAILLDMKNSGLVSKKLDSFLASSRISIQPVTKEQALIAREAYRKFGKGTGHPTQLNFGDCFAYALSKTLNEPLLAKGNDFPKTDVLLAL